ncbi:diguanylate cyclase (GGDEF) domain protein [Ruminiclostridium cellobioparum subsp. termitidis CT1112]|uniref:Diguanylate cyclase (GGDEF) domain protein n=1 Tax=Ruminiclostridium cellobioparum subsp. termitidis CT1112 TaxID=1195236 RepID=S0FNZ8_RUMCE|nr:diguanylate cyclase [Ruminiclostridium cellobioparum]EMS73950.1 diguanylate cyclase (GGDEF) domain protein [Ruminiclostridium cellobioparum subsp. termitidis CT1112]
MEYTYPPLLFSLLFFTVFAVYLCIGIHGIYLNPKASLNKLFLAVCISLCLWSLGFSMTNSASGSETSLFWRRLAALGWTSSYSILLHFILVLTGKTGILKRSWFYILLYLPALINLYIFSLSIKMSAMQSDMVEIDTGWDLFFYIYYAGYLLAILVLIWIWKQKSSERNVQRQAKLIFTSFLIVSFGSSNLTNTLPQMAPVFILIPIIAIYYSIQRYGLMQHKIINKDELILDDKTRTILFDYLSIGFLTAGLLGFLSEFLPHTPTEKSSLYSNLLTGGLLLGIGFVIMIIQRLVGEDKKNTLNTIVLLFSIPLITLRFLQYAGITVWAFPVVFVIISLVFNKRSLLLGLTAVSIITQILMWIYMPKTIVQVDAFDYILRIGIFILALWIGLYVNKIYVARLRENAYQISFQRMLSEILIDFVRINQTNFDEKTNHLLETIGRFLQVDRTYFFLFNHDNNTMACTHEWCNQGIEPEIAVNKDIPFSVFPWWMEQLEGNKLVCIQDVSQLPAEAGAEKKQLQRQKVKSLVSVPIKGNGRVQGFLGINAVTSFKEWSPDHIKMLKILANLLADGLIKIKEEKEIEIKAYYDHLTALPNRILFAERLSQAIHLAKQSGKFVAVMFIDLDDFKTVNDTMGHSGGDALIKEVAQRLERCLRETDTVARFGGDEFLIMINNIPDDKDITKIVMKIMGLFERPIHLFGQEFFITGSAGVSVYPVDGEDTETLTQNADIAMYKAKGKGKNQCVLFTADMKDEVQQDMKLTHSLYRTKERQKLPLLSAASQTVYGSDNRFGGLTELEPPPNWYDSS